MSVTDLLPIYMERSAAVQTFWNFHITVSLAVLGFVTAAHSAVNVWPVQLLISFAFVAFALSNLGALAEVQQQRHVLSGIMHRLADRTGEEDQQRLASLASPPQVWKVRLFHLAMDCFVVAAVWLVPLLVQVVL
ncbi:hypothetical protein N9089_05405 [Crocinitomicaceae bacterium]|nr:hypothetical protein [Crocinitomicaceae bacterium]